MRRLLVVMLLAGCPRPKPAACFDVIAEKNSPTTEMVFEQLECQGGGVTWAELLRVLAQREGRSTGYDLDEEGDAARFCSSDDVLLKKVREQYERLNSDEAQLRKALAEGSALNLECEALR